MLQTLLVCGLYMVVGPSLMILNKEVMSDDSVGFHFPFILSSLGLVFTTAVTHTMYHFKMIKLSKPGLVTRDFYMKKMMPVGLCHAMTLAFGNTQYIYLGMALIQFLKAFTPIVVTVFSVLLLNKKISPQIWGSLFIICIGTSLTAMGDVNLTFFGLFLAVGSSVFEAIRLVLTQFALQDCQFDLLEGQYYLAPAGAFFLFTFGVFVEGPAILNENKLGLFFEYPYHFLACAALGLFVQLLTSAVIKVTSSITLKVLSQMRNACVVFSGIFLYSEIVLATQFFGYLMSVVGFILYSYLSQREAAERLPSSKKAMASI